MLDINLPKLTIDLNDIENMGFEELTDRLNIDRFSDVLNHDWFPFNVVLPVNLPELIMNRVKNNQSFYEIHNDLSEYVLSRYTDFKPSLGLTEVIDAMGWV
jgi:hypothetical protein